MRSRQVELPINDVWNLSTFSESPEFPATMLSWRSLFPNGAPQISPVEAYSAVLLYPDDGREITERESQPFLFDYVDDLAEENSLLQTIVKSAGRILIAGCDAALHACIRSDSEKNYTVLYRWDNLAQKQAQALWNQCARTQKWDQLKTIKFLSYLHNIQATLQQSYELMYFWVPFEQFDKLATLEKTIATVVRTLTKGGIVVLSGIPALENLARQLRLNVLYAEYVQNLPTFRLHQAILPKAKVYQDLMVYVLQKH